MATSFLRQLLNMTGLQLPNPDGQYDPSVYRDESPAKPQPAAPGESAGQLTGVEKYLAKKNPKQPEQPAPSPELTGVAKYLAQKHQQEEATAKARAEKLANMTGVARYLAKLEAGRPDPAPAASTDTPAPKKELTGVDKYLAKQKTSAQNTVPVKKTVNPTPVATHVTKAEPKPQTTIINTATEIAKPVEAQPTAETKPEPAPAKKEKEPVKPTATASKIIDLAEKATQCQAATQKGSRCRRKNNLSTIKHKDGGKQYTFAVCNQHNNADFTPFTELLAK